MNIFSKIRATTKKVAEKAEFVRWIPNGIERMQ
jgi:hypothetical protein